MSRYAGLPTEAVKMAYDIACDAVTQMQQVEGPSRQEKRMHVRRWVITRNRAEAELRRRGAL